MPVGGPDGSSIKMYLAEAIVFVIQRGQGAANPRFKRQKIRVRPQQPQREGRVHCGLTVMRADIADCELGKE